MGNTIQSVTAGVQQDQPRPVPRTGETRRAPPSSQPASPVGANQPGSAKIAAVVEDVNTMVHQFAATKISFHVDEETGRSVVRVVDKETGDVIRQVPPEELLTLVARMRQLSGLIFSKEV